MFALSFSGLVKHILCVVALRPLELLLAEMEGRGVSVEGENGKTD